MLLGLFDFGKKRNEAPDESPDAQAVGIDMGIPDEAVEAIWNSLASELDELSLDELDEQLAESATADPELEAWSEISDEDALRALVDAFVQEGQRTAAPAKTEPDDPEWQSVGSLAEETDPSPEEAARRPEGSDADARAPGVEDATDSRSSNAMLNAADLLSDLMEEDGGALTNEDAWDPGKPESDAKDTAAGILKNFHAEVPEGTEELPPVAGPETSGVVSDEVVLALMHAGDIRVAQVYEASRHRRPGEPLWRAMLEVEEVDRGTLLAEVARQAGYPTFPVSEGLPVRNLVDNMRETMPRDAVEAVLLAGALPVEIGIEAETLEYRLKLVCDDPASPELLEAASALPMEAELFYTDTAQVEAWLDEVWPDRPPRPSREPFTADELPQPATDHPHLRLDRPPMERASAGGSEQEPEEQLSGQGGQDVEAGAAEPGSFAPGVEQDIELLDRRARKDRVVAALFKEGTISVEHVEKALQKYGQGGAREAIWRIMASIPGVDREKIFSKAARVYAFPRVEIGPSRPDHEFVMLIMETIAEERREDLLRLNLLPYEYAIDTETGGARLMFVTHDPARSEVHQLLSRLKVGRFELRYASEAELTGVITEIFPKRNEYLDRMSGDESAFDLGTEYQEENSGLVDETALEAEMSRSTLINMFEASLIEAVRQGASDIHVFPNPKRHIEILFRVDGRLRRWHVDEKIQAEAFLAVVKDNATNVDRFERDAAQDGFIQRRVDEVLIRFRVSVLPIASANQEIRAESVVIRVLDDRKVLTDLSRLGMLDSAMERMQHAISQPHGMVILTGPTGSGKSTTLVAALHQVITPEVNVLTIEDPVEYIINGVRQIKLSHKLGLEDAIRAVLRHDPDIVMVGEMRDKATADLAIKLANTGHLTFSTLHTNDAPSAVSRLYKMGVEPFLLAYAINLVVAQRLIRQLCPSCKREAKRKDVVLMKRLGFSQDEIDSLVLMEPGRNEGCPTCAGAGFKGRRAISETLYFTEAIRHIVAESGEDIDEAQIKDKAVEEGMLTLQDCARELVRQGHTSLAEMMRVTAS